MNCNKQKVIIITKFGLLLLEVKGGNVKCQDGIWKYSGKTTRNSPGTQAKEAFYHLDANYLKASAGMKRITQNIPMGFGCVFPEISRIVSHDESPLPEQDDAITCYRDEARDELDNFIEVYVKCPIEICMRRDPKALYQRRKEGLEKLVVGIDIEITRIPHPSPASPLANRNGGADWREAVEKVLSKL